MNAALRHLLLCLADDELVLGHRDSEWTAFAPFIEEDVAMASIAQDEISHASVFFNLLKDLGGDDPDRLAFLRDAPEFRNARLLERPNGDWAYTVVRHFLYDLFDDLRLDALAASSCRELAQVVDRLRREERYHLMHGRAWVARLAGAEGEARSRFETALEAVLADVPGLFEMTALDRAATEAGFFPGGAAGLASAWAERAREELAPFGLAERVPGAASLLAVAGGEAPRPEALGGREGAHTEDLDRLLGALGEVYRSDPQAAW
ncbi:MAG: phenylacetate-CoA oxygenase subunit PaaC [Clostridia bacterium]|nr:phenylacetate-CoA oxygenase subunit PaaC [Clostridia bacterium]